MCRCHPLTFATFFKRLTLFSYDRRRVQNDIAVAQTGAFFPQEKVIPLCDKSAKLRTLLGTCGLGRISIEGYRDPETLMETYFNENFWWRFVRWFLRKPDILQAKRILGDNAICNGDSGSPLYVLNGLYREPQCVYGVTSYFTGFKGQPDCQGRSFFANVVFFRKWIETIVSQNSDE